MKAYSDVIWETYACHQILASLGFSVDDIYVMPNGGLKNDEVIVVLKAQGKEVNGGVGKRGMSIEDFEKTWVEFLDEVKTLPLEETKARCDATQIRRHAVELVTVLELRGIRCKNNFN